jgi:hypothetical protein
VTVTDREVTYEPAESAWAPDSIVQKIYQKGREKVHQKLGLLNSFSYDEIWKKCLHTARRYKGEKLYYSGFVGFDDTPRRGKNARIVIGATPQKFEKYLGELLDICQKQNKEFVFLTAWNEWGEGAYLEPDVTNGFAYLEAIKRATDKRQASTEM